MRKEDCFFLGNITRRHGYAGGLIVKLDTDRPENYYEMESVLLDMGTELIPFFIRAIEVHKPDQIRVEFEGVKSAEANALLGRELYLPLSFLPKLDGTKFYYHEIEQFRAVDETKGEIGTIAYVIDRQAQPIIIVKSGEKEILIPATNDIISRIDRAEKVMYFQCPEGLLDLYL